MRYSAHRLRFTRPLGMATLLAVCWLQPLTWVQAAPAAAAAAAQPARWEQKKIYFTYLGFTTHYSCEGLTDQVRRVLLELGARKADMHVHEAGCTSRLGEPEPFPAVQGTFFVLEPVAPSQADDPSAHPGIVPAHWQPVNVHFDHQNESLDMSGQCELLEQVRQHILPLFPARNVQFNTLCIPHQLTAGGNTLQAEVLIPDTAGPSHTRNTTAGAGTGELARAQ